MRQQPTVGLVRRLDLEQLVGAPLEVLDAQPELLRVDHLALAAFLGRRPLALITQAERVLEQPPDRVRNAGLAGERVLDQPGRALEQMRVAGLMGGVLEAAIRRPAVALQHAREVLAENLRGVLIPAAGDQIHRHAAVADERPQPLLARGDPPAGLVRGDHRAVADRQRQRLVGRLQRLRLAGDRLHHPARRDLDPELGQRPRRLLGREPQFLVQLRRERHRPRSEHRSRRTKRVGGLVRMTALMAFATTATAPAIDAETPADGPRLRQLLLVLLNNVDELDLPAPLAPLRSRRLERLVNLRRRSPVTLATIPRPCPSPRPARLLLGLPTRERRRLTLRRTPQLLELSLQLLDPRPQPLVLPHQPDVLTP